MCPKVESDCAVPVYDASQVTLFALSEPEEGPARRPMAVGSGFLAVDEAACPAYPLAEQEVELHRPFRAPELDPIEKRQRKVDHARVQTDRLVLEPGPLADPVSGDGGLALAEQLLEHGMVQRPRPMGVGAGQRGALRRVENARELALASGRAAADLAQTVSAAELTEQHGDQLAPAREALCGVAGTVLLHGLFELEMQEELKQLGEDAGKLLLGRAS